MISGFNHTKRPKAVQRKDAGNDKVVSLWNMNTLNYFAKLSNFRLTVPISGKLICN
jgi:hypothetical protein